MDVVRTVGHGTLGIDEFVALLRQAGVAAIADVRRYPGSRRHPHVARLAMQSSLAEAGIAYRWIEALGGRRTPRADSPNIALRNEQFRGYADHMATDDFARGLDELEMLSSTRPTAVMCSESLWWRCHRRLIADHLVLVDATAVEHLFHDGHATPHEPLPEARLDGRVVVYDAVRQPSMFDEDVRGSSDG